MPASREPHTGESLRLLTLGRAVVVDAAGAPVVGQRRRIALLAIVAAAGERGMSRDKAMACLSPERTTDSARHALHQLLYYIRQQGGNAVFSGTDPLRINTSVLTSDVAMFDAAFEAGAFEEAVQLYHGPFLDGFHLSEAGDFDEWVSVERARLAGRHRSALLALARDAQQRGDSNAAVAWSQALSVADPLSVPAALEEMRAMAASNDRAGALRVAQVFQRRMHDAFGASPDVEVEALAASLRAAAASPAPRATPPASPIDGAAVDPSAVDPSPPDVAARDEHPAELAPSAQPGITPTPAGRRALGVVIAVVLVAVLAGIIAAIRPSLSASGASSPEDRVIALLPVENEAGDSVEYLATGIENAVHDALQRMATVRVVPPSVMQQYPPAARAGRSVARHVGAAVLLRSHLVREQDSLLWIADLVTADGARIGGGRFALGAVRMSTFEANVFDSITTALRLTALAAAATVQRDGEVRLLVMRADHFMLNRDPESVRRAHQLLNEAIERDPTDADAYSRLSGVYGILGTYGVIEVPQAFELARAAARRALELDANQSMAMANLAYERNVRFWEWADGERELRRALELEPWRATTWNMLGTVLRMTGRFAEAREAIEQARILDPLARHYTYQVGHIFRCAGQRDSALVWLRRALVISPDYVTAHEMLADVHAARGFPDSALAEWRNVSRIAHNSSDQRLLTEARGEAGLRRFLAQRARLRLQQHAATGGAGYVSSFSLAVLHSSAGDSTRALDYLERATRERDPSLPSIGCISAFVPLRQAPRFRAIVRGIGLTEASFGKQ